MMIEKWEPWVKYKQPLERLPIGEPPCKHCAWWNPVRNYDEEGEFDGVTMCTVRDGQESDFSCYKQRPAQKRQPDPTLL